MNRLAEIPGGWTTRDIEIAGRTLRIRLPSSPEAFLDDPAVLEESRRNDYMPYWCYLWPASLPMSEAVCRAAWPDGTEILEIGAGIGLVGLAALACGYRVTFSDYRQEAVDVALFNAQQNRLKGASGALIDWNAPPPLDAFPVILGCDVLYERRNHAPILRLLETTLLPDGCAWFGDAGRDHAAAFVAMARAAGYRIALFDENGAPLDAPRVGAFQLITLTRD